MRLCLFSLLASVLITQVASPLQSAEDDHDSPPKSQLRVAAAQIPVTLDVGKNEKTIAADIDEAAAADADILLTPEGSLSGYTHEFDQSQVVAALQRLVRQASKVRLALALGTCFVEPDDDRCYNQIRFYDAQGKFLGFHNKILRCGSMSDPPVGEINHYAARPLRTFQLHGITVGGLICNDMWANPMCTPMPDPHLSQQLARKGARIIFHAINGGRSDSEWSHNVFWPYHETNLRMRAQIGKIWVVTADNCLPLNVDCSAPTGVLRPDGSWAIQAPRQGRQLVLFTIDLD
jgi:predicted amidohydrolase